MDNINQCCGLGNGVVYKAPNGRSPVEVQLTLRGDTWYKYYVSGDSDNDFDCGGDTALTQPGLELDPFEVCALTMV